MLVNLVRFQIVQQPFFEIITGVGHICILPHSCCTHSLCFPSVPIFNSFTVDPKHSNLIARKWRFFRRALILHAVYQQFLGADEITP